MRKNLMKRRRIRRAAHDCDYDGNNEREREKGGAFPSPATERGRAPARAPAAAARRRPFFLTMKLTPMKAEEATARSAPVRLAAKRSPAAFGVAGFIGGVQLRRREAGAFGAGPGADLEMEVGIVYFFNSGFVVFEICACSPGEYVAVSGVPCAVLGLEGGETDQSGRNGWDGSGQV